MSSSFFMSFRRFLYLLIILTIILCCFFIPTIFSDNSFHNLIDTGYSFSIGNDEYVWPTPGYTSISSYFGRRYSPTAGASSYHKGIDIAAPQGSNLIAVTSGKITFTGFLGGGGYTITLSSSNLKITYCHISPHFIVKTGDIVQKGQIIRICWS